MTLIQDGENLKKIAEKRGYVRVKYYGLFQHYFEKSWITSKR